MQTVNIKERWMTGTKLHVISPPPRASLDLKLFQYKVNVLSSYNCLAW